MKKLFSSENIVFFSFFSNIEYNICNSQDKKKGLSFCKMSCQDFCKACFATVLDVKGHPKKYMKNN